MTQAHVIHQFSSFCHSKLNFIVRTSADSSNGKFVFTFIHKVNLVKIAVNANYT